jgi:uncharacterized membrane protein YqaE (UPF0057 family)
MPVSAIISAILLPPLGVFLVRGRGRDFRIALLLTMLAFVPGMLFALTVLVRNRRPVTVPAA